MIDIYALCFHSFQLIFTLLKEIRCCHLNMSYNPWACNYISLDEETTLPVKINRYTYFVLFVGVFMV